jgi:hypothetical protein
MRKIWNPVIVIALFNYIALPPAFGASETAPTDGVTQTIVVDDMKNADGKSYRRLIKGMDAFEKNHQLAPDAVLRFKVHARKFDEPLDGIELKIRGEDFSIPLLLAHDLSFVVPRDQRAIDQDASLLSNRKADTFAWYPEVRSPGVPANARRLGDLRLECKILMSIGNLSHGGASSDVPLLLHVIPDLCGMKALKLPHFEDRPIFNVTLHNGQRRRMLTSDSLYADEIPDVLLPLVDYSQFLDHVYMLTMGDSSWPNDTLVEFEYMDDDNAPASQSPASAVMLQSQPTP